MSEQQLENDDLDDHEDVEAKAREMGWKPAEEWVGDTSRHIADPEKFIQHQEKLLAKADAAAQKRISGLQSELGELKQTIKDLGTHLTKADERAYERARRDLQARMDAAVEEGDTDAYKRARADAADLEKEVEAAAKAADEAKPAPATQTREDPNFTAWHKDNDWYGDHLKATIYAEQVASAIAGKHTGEAFYAKITEAVKEEFPDLFENTNRKKAASVEGTTNASGGGGKTLWEQVDKEGKDAFNRFVKQGVFENTKKDKERYARDWGAEE